MSVKILCVGEVLWDKLPEGYFIGGAPFNTACHLKQLGIEVVVVSRLGNDELGKNAIHKIKELGLTPEFIQLDSKYNTGIVNVDIVENGDATYEIVEPSAWDFINLNQEMIKASNSCDLIVYGTLAQRNEVSRETIRSLVNSIKTRVYDVNFRPPFIDKGIIEESLKMANIIKMNEDEFVQISKWFNVSSNLKSGIKELSQKYDCSTICVTKGAEGAIIFREGEIYEHNGFSVKVKDTVGSGDAFLAALVFGIVNKKDNSEIIRNANAIGAFVAMHDGAIPKIDISKINKLVLQNNTR